MIFKIFLWTLETYYMLLFILSKILLLADKPQGALQEDILIYELQNRKIKEHWRNTKYILTSAIDWKASKEVLKIKFK